jgi:hypothetical protein
MRNVQRFMDKFSDGVSADKIKMVLGAGALAAVAAGTLGYGPLKDTYSWDNHKVGSELSYAIPAADRAPIAQEWLATKGRELIRGSDSYSAGRYAVSRGLDATELASLAMENPKGQRGIFDIPGVDKDFAQKAHDNVRDLPFMMRPAQMKVRVIDTISGEERDNLRSRVMFHERAAEKSFVAGDTKQARESAAIALSGVSLLSKGGMEHYRQAKSPTKTAGLER